MNLTRFGASALPPSAQASRQAAIGLQQGKNFQIIVVDVVHSGH
jgi:hypothetical protein